MRDAAGKTKHNHAKRAIIQGRELPMSKKVFKPRSISRRRLLATAGAALAATPLGVNLLQAQQGPIRIGMSMPQTGGLAGGGKASLLGIEIWRDDVNAKGGLLGGRKVELVVYDDK